MKVIKKPEEFDAVQWNRVGDHPAVRTWTARGNSQASRGWAFLPTPRGRITVEPGDWIVTDAAGDIRTYKPAVFARMFEQVRP